jgi:CRISPR-associated protein Cas2
MVKVLVIYDISNDTNRNKLAENLFKLGLSRIQRSAFLGDIDSQRLKDVVRICQRHVRDDGDIIHIVPLGLRDWERRIVVSKKNEVRSELFSLVG